MSEEFVLPYFQQVHPQFPIEDPMSPRSAASTPPIISATCDASLASFNGPVSISTAHFSLPLPTLSVSRQESFATFYPHQLMGAPPPPKPPTLIPSGSATASSMSLANTAPDAAPSGTGGPQRKRPKYTRSKKGCLTCRSKKIKCDERRPSCTRCEHGHRECTWPEAVLPRRPKGAMRGVGNEDDEDEEDGRPSLSMPSSAVSTQFPTSATSAQFPPFSPFEPAPTRDAYDSEIVYGAGPSVAQFAQAMPILDAPSRGTFYQRSSVTSTSGISPAAPSNGSEFYPLTTGTAVPLDEYEYPPRQQQFNSGSRGSYSNGTGGSGVYSNGSSGASYTNGGSYSNGTPGNWNDGRRPSWDATSVVTHASSVSSPASSALGLGLGGISRSGGSGSAGSSAGGNSSGGGLMLLHSPDPLSPFFRSVQERNLVGNFSSSCFSSSFSSSSSFDSTSSLSPFSSSYSLSSSVGATTPALTFDSSATVSPTFGPTSSGSASTTPTLSSSPFYPPKSHSSAALLRPLTIDPPVSISITDIDQKSSLSALDCDSSSFLHHPPRWQTPSSLDGSQFPMWNVYS